MTRRTGRFALFVIALLGLVALMAVHAALAARSARSGLREEASLVRRLELTDLCLSTEANYTRHLSLADFHTAFQDHPLALEHFPSGALFGPPPHLRRSHGRLD
jgi:hypothetical protein